MNCRRRNVPGGEQVKTYRVREIVTRTPRVKNALVLSYLSNLASVSER